MKNSKNKSEKLVLSFNPVIIGNKNLLCAGRDPGKEEKAEMESADLIILGQGCRQSLYEMAKNTGKPVFPNYDAKFEYPEKSDQIKLFEKFNVPCPKTEFFSSISRYEEKNEKAFKFPNMFKFNWGGQGDTVYFLSCEDDLKKALEKAGLYEKSGQKGFMLQEYIDCKSRVLRVVIAHDTAITYWRVAPENQKIASAAKNGIIDKESDPLLQKIGKETVLNFTESSKINLAGFDLLFPEKIRKTPCFLK